MSSLTNKLRSLLPFLVIFLLTIYLAAPYIFNHKVLFPGNLLYSFYQPFASYPTKEYPSGPPNKPVGFDNLRIYYPLRNLAMEEIRGGNWPLWNPYAFAGNTLLATYQSAIFYPLSFLFFILPQVDAWSVISLLIPGFASICMYLFLKNLSLSKKSSLFGAISFGFSGFFFASMQESFMNGYSALVLPLLLLGMYKLQEKIRWKYFLLILLGSLFSILSGWFQMTLYVELFSLVWAIYLFTQNHSSTKKQALFWNILAILLSVPLAGIHLIPGFEAFLASARGTTDAKFLFDTYLVPFSHLITYLVPDFFGNPGTYNYYGSGFFYEKVLFAGSICFIFGLYQLLRFKILSKNEKFFLWSWLISLSLGISLPTSWLILYYLKLPFISTILPSRIFFLSTTCLCTLAAFGLESFLKNLNKKLLFISLAIGLSAIVVGDGIVFLKLLHHYKPVEMSVALKNSVLPFVLLIIFLFCSYVFIKKRKYILIFFITLLVLSSASLIYSGNKYLQFSQRQFVFPTVPVIAKLQQIAKIDRYWSIGAAYIPSNISTYYRISSAEGYDSFFIARFGELVFAAANGGVYRSDIPRADAMIVNVSSITKVQQDPYRMRLLSLLGVKYIVAPSNNTFSDDARFTSIWKDAAFTIYQYKNVLPRSFIADNFVVANTQQKILSVLFNPTTHLEKTVILEEQPHLSHSDIPLEASAHITLYTPNKVVISTRTNKQSMLFLSDAYFPGWKAYVDGKVTKVLRADYAFRAVVIPPGQHVISFVYEPESLKIGLAISAISIVATGIVILLIKKKYETN